MSFVIYIVQKKKQLVYKRKYRNRLTLHVFSLSLSFSNRDISFKQEQLS